jgi:hypothetical protein
MVTRHRDKLLQTCTRADEITWSDWGIDNPAEDADDESMDVETDDTVGDKDYYDFKQYIVSDRDVALFEITKPFTDLPYTLVRT